VTPAATQAKSVSKVGLLIPWIIAAVLGGGYYAVWLGLASAAKAQIAQRIAQSSPGSASIGSVEASGFPFRLSLTLTDAKIAQRVAGWGFNASSVRLTAMPWNLSHWIVDQTSGLQLRTPAGKIWSLEAPLLEASAHWGASGIQRISLVTGGFRANRQDGATITAKKAELHLQADPKKPSDLAFVVDLETVALPGTPDAAAVLGTTLEKLRLAGMIPKGQGFIADATAWLRNGGVFEPKDGTLNWGPLQVANITGKLGTTPNGELEGTLAGTGGLVAGGTNIAGPLALSISKGNVSTGPFTLVKLPAVFVTQPITQN